MCENECRHTDRLGLGSRQRHLVIGHFSGEVEVYEIQDDELINKGNLQILDGSMYGMH